MANIDLDELEKKLDGDLTKEELKEIALDTFKALRQVLDNIETAINKGESDA